MTKTTPAQAQLRFGMCFRPSPKTRQEASETLAQNPLRATSEPIWAKTRTAEETGATGKIKETGGVSKNAGQTREAGRTGEAQTKHSLNNPEGNPKRKTNKHQGEPTKKENQSTHQKMKEKTRGKNKTGKPPKTKGNQRRHH